MSDDDDNDEEALLSWEKRSVITSMRECHDIALDSTFTDRVIALLKYVSKVSSIDESAVRSQQSMITSRVLYATTTTTIAIAATTTVDDTLLSSITINEKKNLELIVRAARLRCFALVAKKRVFRCDGYDSLDCSSTWNNRAIDDFPRGNDAIASNNFRDPCVVHLIEIDELVDLCESNDKVLSYVDLCYDVNGSGTSAALEYINWRKRWTSRGFAIAAPRISQNSHTARNDDERVRTIASSYFQDIPILRADVAALLTASIRWPKVDMVFATEIAENFAAFEARILFSQESLCSGGSLLIKTSSFVEDDECRVLDALSKLAKHFASVIVIKPSHSRISEDDRYVLFRDYDQRDDASREYTTKRALLLAEIDISLRRYFFFYQEYLYSQHFRKRQRTPIVRASRV